MSPSPASAVDSSPTPRNTVLRWLLAASALLWVGSIVHAGFALRELADIRRRNEERAARIHSLDPEFRALVTRDLAIGRLLDQVGASGNNASSGASGGSALSGGSGGSAPRPFGATATTSRPLPADIGGHALREITATWDSIPAETLALALHDAESSSPPLRLRRIELTPRPGAKVSATAVFETLF